MAEKKPPVSRRFFDTKLISVDEYRYLWFLLQKWNQ